MVVPVDLPSHGLDAATLDGAANELVETLRSLIRIPSVNPPADDRPDAETLAARWIAAALEDAGVPSEVLELVPGRGSVVSRLRRDGTGGAARLLLIHRDVVPAPVNLRTHQPSRAN